MNVTDQYTWEDEFAPEPEPDFDYPTCTVCGHDMEREECYKCFGDGGRDLYEENPNEYEPGDWEPCDECNGVGLYWECPNVPHMEASA